MSSDEQMTMALLALGAVALFAMNNNTASKPPVRRKADAQNAKRVEIQGFIEAARKKMAKIETKTQGQAGDENGKPDQSDLDDLNSMRMSCLSLVQQATKLGIPTDSPSIKGLEQLRTKVIEPMYNRSGKTIPTQIINLTDASQRHLSVQSELNITKNEQNNSASRILNMQLASGSQGARESGATMEVDQTDNARPIIDTAHRQGLPGNIEDERENEANLTTQDDLNKPSLFSGPSDTVNRPREDHAEKTTARGVGNSRGVHAGTANVGGKISTLDAATGKFGLATAPVQKAGGFAPARGKTGAREWREKKKLQHARVQLDKVNTVRTRAKRQATIEAAPTPAINFDSAPPNNVVALPGPSPTVFPPANPKPEPTRITRPVAPPAPLLQTTNDETSRRGGSQARQDKSMSALPAQKPTPSGVDAPQTTTKYEGRGFGYIKEWTDNDISLFGKSDAVREKRLLELLGKVRALQAQTKSYIRDVDDSNKPNSKRKATNNNERQWAIDAIDKYFRPFFLGKDPENFVKAYNKLSPEWSSDRGLQVFPVVSPENIFFHWWAGYEELLPIRNRIRGTTRTEQPSGIEGEASGEKAPKRRSTRT